MRKNAALKIVAGIAGSFIALVAAIVLLWGAKAISFEMAMLMLVALLGLYVGLGLLVFVYRLVSKME